MNVRTLCQGCGRQGLMPFGADHGKKPRWCRCKVRKGLAGGPYVMAPGSVVRITFETQDEAAWRERCRLAGNAELQARDEVTSARWTDKGRKRPNTHPLVKAAVKTYRAARRELEALQAVCPHTGRSRFNRIFCAACYAQVECDVEHFRHLVRELGKRNAMRLAV